VCYFAVQKVLSKTHLKNIYHHTNFLNKHNAAHLIELQKVTVKTQDTSFQAEVICERNIKKFRVCIVFQRKKDKTNLLREPCAALPPGDAQRSILRTQLDRGCCKLERNNIEECSFRK